MGRHRRFAIASGALCAVVVFAALSLGAGPRTPGPDVALPDELAGYSYFTGDVSTAPPGRVLATYQHGFGVEFLDFPGHRVGRGW